MCLAVAGLYSCGGGAAKQNAPAELKAMTFNIRYANPADGENAWEYRKEAVIDMVHALKPDIMGIQEGLEGQVIYLDSALSDYSYVGVGRDDGAAAGEYSAVYYNNKRFELTESGNFWLNENPETIAKGWDADHIRICTWARLKDREAGKELLVFNTHFDNTGEVARRESAKLMLERVKNMTGDGFPTIIMGDFNCAVSDPSLAPLAEAPTFKESRSSAVRVPQGDSIPPYTYQGFSRQRYPHAAPIDHIFVQVFEPMEYVVVTDGYGVPYLSDHFPVMVTLEY